MIYLMIMGLGLGFHGALILWVAGLPRMLRPGESPTAEKGTPRAFMLFWLDQYSFIGLGLLLLGSAMALTGYLL
ncbi:MAG: hypothetical protein O3B72_00240 [Proteobacteria bacterium]|nr:hypothetical protein [Pseudomonadota bacterium]